MPLVIMCRTLEGRKDTRLVGISASVSVCTRFRARAHAWVAKREEGRGTLDFCFPSVLSLSRRIVILDTRAGYSTNTCSFRSHLFYVLFLFAVGDVTATHIDVTKYFGISGHICNHRSLAPLPCLLSPPDRLPGGHRSRVDAILFGN